MLQWLSDNFGLIVSVLFGISEALALIPQVKANSVFQLILSALTYLKGGGAQPPAPQAPVEQAK